MITVQNLVKTYGQVAALQGITFEVPSGQVLGFLGPNGAGKSTTMKILTGYLYPTSGRVEVDGIDVEHNPLEVRRRVGYLPETNPLYGDMRVDDYLRFVAEIRGLPRAEVRSYIDRVVQICGLPRVLKKGIMELSKGFRQRVGLAQAMVHDPQILILDEPTSGLDPNQIIEIRELVRSLGANRTVILSTHYLQEVEATCDRIMIVAQGRIVADGTRDELCARLPAGGLTAEILGPAERVTAALRQVLPGGHIETIPMAAATGGVRLRVDFKEEPASDPRLLVHDVVQRNGWKVLEMHRERASLETVFRSMTSSDGAAAPRRVAAAAAAGGDA